jgi:hypothetical protein
MGTDLYASLYGNLITDNRISNVLLQDLISPIVCKNCTYRLSVIVIDCRLLLSFSVGACLMSSDQYAMKSVDVLSLLTNQKNPFIFNKKNINVQKCFFDRLN